jgi:hypothetical protein
VPRIGVDERPKSVSEPRAARDTNCLIGSKNVRLLKRPGFTAERAGQGESIPKNSSRKTKRRLAVESELYEGSRLEFTRPSGINSRIVGVGEWRCAPVAFSLTRIWDFGPWSGICSRTEGADEKHVGGWPTSGTRSID